MPTSNYFSHASAASRYARYRPYFHPVVMERLRRFTGCARFGRALDVACGTGQSTRALAEMAGEVVGIDHSAAMLAHAPELPNVAYKQGAAEDLPFPDGGFDLVAVGLAFHWFDQDKFLAEARRVLRPHGWLFIYNNVFMSAMTESPGLKRWIDEAYLAKYLAPPRARKKLTAEYARGFGFELAGAENFPNEARMTREQFVGYLSSQSNVIAFVEEGGEAAEDVAAWVDDGVRPFFVQPSGTMQFCSDIWYLRRI